MGENEIRWMKGWMDGYAMSSASLSLSAAPNDEMSHKKSIAEAEYGSFIQNPYYSYSSFSFLVCSFSLALVCWPRSMRKWGETRFWKRKLGGIKTDTHTCSPDLSQQVPN